MCQNNFSLQIVYREVSLRISCSSLVKVELKASQNMTTIKSNNTQNLANFLVIYFNFTFFLCLSPFRLTRTENCFYKAQKNILQTIISILLSSLAIVYIFSNFRQTYVNTSLEGNTSPLKYFELLNTFFMYSFQILAIKNFWASRHRFLLIVNFIQSERDVFPNKPMKVQYS